MTEINVENNYSEKSIYANKLLGYIKYIIDKSSNIYIKK
jgi:hypothetical protein